MDHAARLTQRSTASHRERGIAARRMGLVYRKSFNANVLCSDTPHLLQLEISPAYMEDKYRVEPIVWLTIDRGTSYYLPMPYCPGARDIESFMPKIARIDWWYGRHDYTLHDHVNTKSILTRGMWDKTNKRSS